VTHDHSAAFDFKAVFRSQYPRIVTLIARVVKDRGRAEELAVEAFWKLWRTPKAQGASANAWLYRTALRLGLDELRRLRRREKYERFFGFPISNPTPEELHSIDERQRQVRSVLASMKRRDAELLILRSDSLTYPQIAEVLALNPASVGTLMTRAQQAFRKEYVKRYGQE
jgi:RNA polymerase sigma-70 factor (ECF subfamily)